MKPLKILQDPTFDLSKRGLPISPLARLEELAKESGDFVSYNTRFGTFVLVNNPEVVRAILNDRNCTRTLKSPLRTILGNGLLTSDGPVWERDRRALLPEFCPVQALSLVDQFRAITNSEIDSIEAPNITFDLSLWISRLTLRNITETLLGITLDDKFLEAFAVVMQQLGEITNGTVLGIPLVRSPESNKTFLGSMRYIEDRITEIVDLGVENRCRVGSRITHAGGLEPSSQQNRRNLRDQILTIIAAGHETTAISIAWTWYLVLNSHEFRERFVNEIDSVLLGNPIQKQDICKLTFTRNIINETLRLFPPVWMLARTVIRDMRIRDFLIPANTNVVVSPYLLHRNESIWDNALEFDPTRFEKLSSTQEEAYIPFLAGRHHCLGKHFSLNESTVVLATMAQRLDIQKVEVHQIEPLPLLSLRMNRPFKASAKMRTLPPENGDCFCGSLGG